MGFFSKLFSGFSELDDDFYDNMEEQLILGDMGVNTTMELVENLKVSTKENKVKNAEGAKELLKDDIKKIMMLPEDAFDYENKKSIIMVIGVNGVGKTTCIGKLANIYKNMGKKVILAGADTFRAAAAEQLKTWAERTNSYVISGHEGADPGSVVFDAVAAAKARDVDLLFCDTAGRLHNKKNLMNELGKIDKIVAGEYADAHRENWIVVDSTTGQNALIQAKEFSEIMNATGIILTKTDGTAKGGIAVAISSELGIPVKFIGTGEGLNDLKKFDPDEYVNSLFE